eukprot:Sspe_Gene.96358::Locus_69022_Transcript_5_5_Confidence_0.364_Length_800::g.96358::m.96358
MGDSECTKVPHCIPTTCCRGTPHLAPEAGRRHVDLQHPWILGWATQCGWLRCESKRPGEEFPRGQPAYPRHHHPVHSYGKPAGEVGRWEVVVEPPAIPAAAAPELVRSQACAPSERGLDAPATTSLQTRLRTPTSTYPHCVPSVLPPCFPPDAVKNGLRAKN